MSANLSIQSIGQIAIVVTDIEPRIRSWTGIEAQEKTVGSRHELP